MTTPSKCSCCGTTDDVLDGTCLPCFKDQCPRCGKQGADAHFDRFGIYSGKACAKCVGHLPGQGAMWDYVPEESVDA